jgi:hypothetical protein
LADGRYSAENGCKDWFHYKFPPSAARPVQAHAVLQSGRAGSELGLGRLDLAQTKTKSNQIRNGKTTY